MTDAALRRVLEDAQRLGFLGPGSIDPHIHHARAWAAAVGFARFLDLGSGAGIPGLVLALELPEVDGVLLDGQTRRAAWLRTAVARLGLASRIGVLEGRAEDLAHDPALRESFPAVFARSFGPPAATAECGAGFTAVGGLLTVSEPPNRQNRWPPGDLGRLGLGMARRIVHGGSSFVILPKTSGLDDDFPRRRNLPTRSPLW